MSRKNRRPLPDATVGTVVSVPGSRKWLKIFVIVFVLVFLAVTSVLGYRWAYRKITNNDGSAQICSDDMLRRATEQIEPQNVAKLQPIVDEIISLPKYQTDPNCLGVTTMYYVNISSSSGAKANYDQLVVTYNEDEGYNDILVGKVLRPDQFKPVVEFLEKQYEEIRKNSTTGPEVSP